MKNLFAKKSKKKIPDEIATRQVSFKVLKKKTSFETDRRESTQQTNMDAAKFLQRMESIGEVHMDFNNEDMHQEFDLIHPHKRSTARRQSRKGRGEQEYTTSMNTTTRRESQRRDVKQSQKKATAAPIQKLKKMDLYGNDQVTGIARPRSGNQNTRDLAPAAALKIPSSQAVPQNTDSARPVRKATYKRGSMDVCLGFDDSQSEVWKDVNSPPQRKRRSLDMTDAASEDIVQPDVMKVDPRSAALHAAAHQMHKQQFEDRRRVHPDIRLSRNIPVDTINVDAEFMNPKRVLQKQVSMPEEATRQIMVPQQFIKQQSMRQFSKSEKQQIVQQQVMPQRQQMMKQQSVRQNSIPVQDQRQMPPKQYIMKHQSMRQGPMPLKVLPREMQRQIPHTHVLKEQQMHDLNRKRLVQDSARDVQVQVQQTVNVWDEINSQQFDDRPHISVQHGKNELRQMVHTMDNQLQVAVQVAEANRNNMNLASRPKITQQEQQPHNTMRPDHISAIPIKKPSNRERLIQRDHVPLKSMQNEQVLMRPDQISAIPMKNRFEPQREQFRQQGQISSRQLRGSPKMQPQQTIASTERPNLNLVRNNASREQSTKAHMDQRKEHDEWYQSELQMPKVPLDQMLRARNARFHQIQKQHSVRTYQSNSSSESRDKDVRTEMIRNYKMNGQSTKTFESNSSSESRESARLYAQVADVQNNKTDDMIEQMTIVKRRPTLKRGSMDTSRAIIEDL